MAFGQGVAVKRGLPVLFCAAKWGNRDNCSYTRTSLFVALIDTYTRVHKQVASLVFHVTFLLALSLQR